MSLLDSYDGDGHRRCYIEHLFEPRRSIELDRYEFEKKSLRSGFATLWAWLLG